MSSDPDGIKKIVVALEWRSGARTPAWERLWERILRDVLSDDRDGERVDKTEDAQTGDRRYDQPGSDRGAMHEIETSPLDKGEAPDG